MGVVEGGSWRRMREVWTLSRFWRVMRVLGMLGRCSIRRSLENLLPLSQRKLRNKLVTNDQI